MLSGALGFARLVCCGLVIASFAMFADDQINGASKHQVAEIAGQSASRTGTGTVVDPDPGQPRRFIDQTASTLTAPFRAVVHSGSQWVQRGFATLCALLVYGFGLGYLTRFSQGRATRSRYRPSPRS